MSPYGNVFTFLMDGDFEASIMLLDEFWDGEFRKFVTGKYAAAIPARDVLAFCDADSTAGIAELQEVINRPTITWCPIKFTFVNQPDGKYCRCPDEPD
jgi:uncharacterized protein YtpQ (UPF0354 family)